MPETAEQWLEGAARHEGSWWPEWQQWLVRDGGEKVKARKPRKEIEPAPGSYVRVR
ncbi:Poly-beta-hydroxybutyrate polymerase [compost metagenome]